MWRISVWLCVTGLTIGLLADVAEAQFPVGSAFTYQGQLKQGGVPVNGTANLEFRLFGGLPFPITTVGVSDVDVVDGLFSVPVDFGPDQFQGSARWLEVAVEFPADAGTWVTLGPRQRVTPTPYASTAMSTVGVDGHSLDAADGSPMDAVSVDDEGRVRMEVGGLTVFDNLAQGVSFNSDNFYFAEASSEDPVYDYAHATDTHRFWTNGAVQMVVEADGNVGIGTDDPETRLHVTGFGDASLTGGGGIVVGNVGSTNLVMDNNEIMARDNGSTATLYLNNEGGDVVTGGDLIVGGNIDIGLQYKTVIESATNPVTAYCDEGFHVISGGCESYVPVIKSAPVEQRDGWKCTTDGAADWLRAHAICARAAAAGP